MNNVTEYDAPYVLYQTAVKMFLGTWIWERASYDFLNKGDS